jgi:hypothetical protein
MPRELRYSLAGPDPRGARNARQNVLGSTAIVRQPRYSRIRQIGRRDFLGISVAVGGALLLGDRLGAAEAGGAKTDVSVIHRTDRQKLMQAAWKVIDNNGGPCMVMALPFLRSPCGTNRSL